MFRNRLLALLLAVCCIAGLSCGAAAAEVDCDSVYCFSAEDFSGETPIAGICITSLPDKKVGSVMLGSRVLVPGVAVRVILFGKLSICFFYLLIARIRRNSENLIRILIHLRVPSCRFFR